MNKFLQLRNNHSVIFGLLTGTVLAIQEILNIITGNFDLLYANSFWPGLITNILLYLGIFLPVKLSKDKAPEKFDTKAGLRTGFITLSITALIYFTASYIFFKMNITDSIRGMLKEKWIKDGFDISQAEFYTYPAVLAIGELMRNILIYGLVIIFLVSIIFRKQESE